MNSGFVLRVRFGDSCIALASPEEELESADKGPEIIVPLYLLERVQCQAAKNLQVGESGSKSRVLKLVLALVVCQLLS